MIECQLSLCDCKCYPKGQTPEEKTGRFCGINCLGVYGISGCRVENNTCTEVKIEEGINNFEECAKAGNPVLESYPRQCMTPDGRTFTEEIID